MSLFDSITVDIAQKFGLGNKAGTLVSSLISHISDHGISGFLNKFHQAGLGDAVSSWISSGQNTSLSAEQLTGALGEDTLKEIASHAGISTNEAKPALAMLIPSVINSLTPNGAVPTSLPASVMGYLKGGAGAAISAAGATLSMGASALGSGADAVRNVAEGTSGVVTKGARGGSFLLKLLSLLALAMIAFWGYKYFNNEITTAASAANTAVSPASSSEMQMKEGSSAITAGDKLGSAPLNETQAAEVAEQQATAALDKLGDNFTAEQLAAAFNLEIINFPSGSATIPQDRQDLLLKNASYLKKLPAGSKLEIGGHTDNTGHAATNQMISHQRAKAVKAFLEKAGVGVGILTAQGYGATKPIASNDTTEGQFKNRRIEFTAIQ